MNGQNLDQHFYSYRKSQEDFVLSDKLVCMNKWMNFFRPNMYTLNYCFWILIMKKKILRQTRVYDGRVQDNFNMVIKGWKQHFRPRNMKSKYAWILKTKLPWFEKKIIRYVKPFGRTFNI